MGHMYTSTHTYTRTYTHTGRTGFGTATKKKTRRREGTRPVRAARGGGWAPLTSSSANERVAKPADASAGTSFSTRVKQVFGFFFVSFFFGTAAGAHVRFLFSNAPIACGRVGEMALVELAIRNMGGTMLRNAFRFLLGTDQSQRRSAVNCVKEKKDQFCLFQNATFRYPGERKSLPSEVLN